MENKEITIIIPVYNAGNNLDICLNSVLKQTISNFEVLLINDGSTDNSLEKILEYQNKYPHVFRILSQDNQGVVATRHRGIEEANTKYIMFMDNDDFIDDNYVERLYNEIVREDLDIVISGYRRATLSKTIFEVHAKNDEWTKYAINAPWARIIKRSLIIDNDIKFLKTPIGEDTYFNLKSYLYTDKVKCIDYIGYNWFYNEESVSNSKQKGLKEECDVLILLENVFELYKERMDNIVSYFFIRHTIWYLLFSGSSASSRRFVQEYNRLFSWLEEKNIKLSIKWYSKKISSEPIKNRIIIAVFYRLHKLKLVGLFAKIYCKNQSAGK